MRLMGCKFKSETETHQEDLDDEGVCQVTTITATVLGPSGQTLTAKATGRIYDDHDYDEVGAGDFGDDSGDIAMEIHGLIESGLITGDELISEKKLECFVFYYDGAGNTGDREESFLVYASDRDAALTMLANHCRTELDWSANVADYREDIDQGNIVVLRPTEIKCQES